MKPEPSELVLCGARSLLPPPLAPGPRRFLQKSSKNSSNGEPGGSCGIAPRPSPLASMVCEVEMLTTASMTFSATSAMPSGPRASAGTETSAPVAPRQIAARNGRRRWLRARVAAVISASLQARDLIFRTSQCARTGWRRKHIASALLRHKSRQYGEKPTVMRDRLYASRPAPQTWRRTAQIRISPVAAELLATTRRILSGVASALFMALRIDAGLAANNNPSNTNRMPTPMRKSANAMDLIGLEPPV